VYKLVYKFKRHYIFKRGETYYFSKQVPKDVRGHYCRSRMVICLKTQSESLAIKSASSFLSKLEEYWAHLRLTTINLPASHLLRAPTQSQRVISDTIKLSEAMEQYCRLKGAGKADTFFSSTSRNINEVIKMFGDLPIDQYSSQDAGKLRDGLMDRGLTTSSVKRIFSTIRAVFNLSINERGLNCTNPFTRTFLPSEESGKRAPISLIDIKRIQDECFKIKDEKRLIIALISDTGMRLSEALGLSWDDVSIDHTYPHIKLKPHPWRSLKTASSSRVVPLVGASYKAINLIKKQQDKSNIVFKLYCNIDRCKSNSASATLNKWLKSRVSNGVMHSFRHSMRDRLRNADVNPELIDEICGWSQQSVGQRYGNGYSLKHKYGSMLGIIFK